MVDSGGTTTYAYDVRNLRIRENRPGALRTTMAYDAVGNRTTLIDPEGGVFTYTYDNVNRLSTLINPDSKTVTAQYDAAGRRTTLLLGLGSKRKYSYDAANRLTTQIELNASNAPIITMTDAYDNVGNRTVHVQDGVVTTWIYDDLSRLISQLKSGERATFTYDAVSNIFLKHHQGTTPMTFTYDAANRITTMAQGTAITTFSYDANGNLVLEQLADATDSESRTTYAYDNADRLTNLKLPGGTQSTFTYDGDGLRRTVRTTADLTPTTFVWDGEDYLMEYQ